MYSVNLLLIATFLNIAAVVWEGISSDSSLHITSRIRAVRVYDDVSYWSLLQGNYNACPKLIV
jgi:hypothetical protein